jgi:hypothetical protein
VKTANVTLTAEQTRLNQEVIDVNWPGMNYFRAVCILDTGAWSDEVIGWFTTEAAAIQTINHFAEVTNITAVLNVRVAPAPYYEAMVDSPYYEVPFDDED